MSKFKVGDRVEITCASDFAGLKIGDKATIKEICGDGIHFINTDKLNNFNYHDYGGNGIYYAESFMKKLVSIKKGKWTMDEQELLFQLYPKHSVDSIAEKLNRTYFAVQSKARSEGIHKHPRREYNDRDNRFIRHTYMDNWKAVEIGRQLHRSKSSIRSRLSLMNDRGLLPSIPKEID